MDFQVMLDRLITGNVSLADLERMQLEALQEFREQLGVISRLEMEAVRNRTLAIILGNPDQIATMDVSLRELDSCRQQINALIAMLMDQMTPATAAIH